MWIVKSDAIIDELYNSVFQRRNHCFLPRFASIKQMMLVHWIALALVLCAVPSTAHRHTFPSHRPAHAPSVRSIRCYNCSCVEPVCPCKTYDIDLTDNSYCTITRENFAQTISIDYGRESVNSSLAPIRMFPFVLVRESITYNEGSGRWNTQPELVVYGCNTDLCNKPSLLPYLPSSFQMRVSEGWLNSSVLGTGQPVRDCHECPAGPVCSPTEFIDGDQCPIQSCNTTCLVANLIDEPATGHQCYQSICAPTDPDGFPIDTHRVEIEAVLYPDRPTTVEFWEIGIYCRADNCSRPEIFQELRQEVTVQPGDLTMLFNLTASPGPRLRCYDCYCDNETACTCDTISSNSAPSSYCTIVRIYDDENVYVYFRSDEIGASYAEIREFPYVRVKEAIFYNNETGQWVTRIEEVEYGCTSDFCNELALLPLLPTSFKMSLPVDWLNATILGTGQSVHDCNECLNDTVCSINGTASDALCPLQACNTTCFASNSYRNASNNEQCYLSYCLTEESRGSRDLAYDPHRVEIQGIVYPSRPTSAELWEVELYCRVDNCSRPEVFEQLKQALVTQPGNLSSLFTTTSTGGSNQLRCYDCYCVNDAICNCNKTATMSASDTYCTIIREYDGQDFWILLEHIDRNSTRVFINEFPYLLVDESIVYNDATEQWITRPTLIVYGCNTDFCNDPRLVPRLPVGFQMRLTDEWLNTNVLGNGQPVRDCHECPDAPQCGITGFLDTSRCPIRSCNTTCLVSDTFNNPTSDELCYQSFCAPPDNEQFTIDPHRVQIEGILYGNRPDAQVEIWEVDIYCRADDCSRPEIFQELQAVLSVDTGDLSAFFNATTTPPVDRPLSCYECACYNDPIVSMHDSRSVRRPLIVLHHREHDRQ